MGSFGQATIGEVVHYVEHLVGIRRPSKAHGAGSGSEGGEAGRPKVANGGGAVAAAAPQHPPQPGGLHPAPVYHQPHQQQQHQQQQQQQQLYQQQQQLLQFQQQQQQGPRPTRMPHMPGPAVSHAVHVRAAAEVQRQPWMQAATTAALAATAAAGDMHGRGALGTPSFLAIPIGPPPTPNSVGRQGYAVPGAHTPACSVLCAAEVEAIQVILSCVAGPELSAAVQGIMYHVARFYHPAFKDDDGTVLTGEDGM